MINLIKKHTKYLDKIFPHQKKTKSKKKITSSKFNNNSNTINNNTQNNQKINDFLMIATTCNAQIASNLLRNANWNVQNALEFYFKHQPQIDGAQKQKISINNSKQIRSKSDNGKPIKFGKAGTRTEKQKKLVKENFDQLFASF
eukprot:719353_1